MRGELAKIELFDTLQVKDYGQRHVIIIIRGLCMKAG